MILSPSVDQRLDRFLREKLPFVSYGTLQKWIRKGVVRVNGAKAKADQRLAPSDQVTVPEVTQPLLPSTSVTPAFRPQTLSLLKQAILYENKDVLILNKPQGLAVQGGSKLDDYLALYLEQLTDDPEPLRIVHRLDKDTSGVLMLAKTKDAAIVLSKALQEKTVEKTYLALCVGVPQAWEGLIDRPLGKMVGGQREKMSLYAPEVMDSQTSYRVLKQAPWQGHVLSFLELKPHTGRTHQLRVHCADVLGCPIVGDGKYGGAQAHVFDKRVPLMLHAHQLKVQGLDIPAFQVIAPLPEGFHQRVTDVFGKGN